MLVATRDPMPQQHGAGSSPGATHAGSRMGRLMLALQLAGSLLAIPVGLATGYSIYRTNFSPETTCQTLRSNIVSMIDKQIDASTRRMLVRRDVETFEKTCGSVDPDAGAAFKALLASDPPATAKASAAEQLPAQEWRRSEARAAPKPAEEAREPKEVKEARVQASEPSPDARWLDAVRHALTAHEAEHAAAQATVKPLVAPSQHGASSVPPSLVAAPTLPPPTTVMSRSAAVADPDHPVPPASIPTAKDP